MTSQSIEEKLTRDRRYRGVHADVRRMLEVSRRAGYLLALLPDMLASGSRIATPEIRTCLNDEPMCSGVSAVLWMTGKPTPLAAEPTPVSWCSTDRRTRLERAAMLSVNTVISTQHIHRARLGFQVFLSRHKGSERWPSVILMTASGFTMSVQQAHVSTTRAIMLILPT